MDYPALLAVLQQHANPERAVPMQAYMKHRFAISASVNPS